MNYLKEIIAKQGFSPLFVTNPYIATVNDYEYCLKKTSTLLCTRAVDIVSDSRCL